MKEVTVTLEIADDTYDYLVGLNALRRLEMLSEDRPYARLLADKETLSNTLSLVINPSASSRLPRMMYDWKTFFCLQLSDMGKGAELADVLERYPALSMELGDDETTFEKPQSERDGEAGDVPTRNPSPDEPKEKPETVSNAEELPHVETLIPFGEPKEEPETLIPIIDASGVRRMATLDEVEAMREAAQGIYAGEPPEPKEPETFSNAGEEFPVVRRGLLMDDKSDLYFYYLEHGELPQRAVVFDG